MSTIQIVWLVVGVIVVLALFLLFATWMRRRNQTANKHAAERLRARATEHAELLPDAQAQAREKAARADRARLEAERAEEEATRAKENLAWQQSEYETSIRSADKLDPDVNTRSKDYAPDLPAVDTTPQPTSAPTTESTTEPMPDPMPDPIPDPTPMPEPEPAPMPEPMSDQGTLQDAHDSRHTGSHRH
jgi:FtsZ-interacting cell division protein ZipA